MEVETRVARRDAPDVIASAAAGDEIAFRGLIAEHQEDMRRVCSYVTGESAIADEATQAAWTAWLFVLIVNAFEWTIIFWASTIVEQQTSVLLRDATLVISMFFAGMVIARSALSLPAVGRQEPIRFIRAGLAVLVVGSVVVWASTSFAISLIGFLAMGIGSGVQFPLGIALTLDTAPLQPQLASSRLALASGLGILVMPLILGVVADASSVSAGWLVVPFMCLIALALTVPVVRDRRTAAAMVSAS